MTAGKIIRRAGVSDTPLLAGLHGECFSPGWSIESLAGLLEDAHVIALITANGSAKPPVSFIMIRWAGGEAEILTLASRPECRRQGHAQALLLAAAEAAFARGAEKLFLEVAQDNDAAIALYKKFGFAEIGVRRAYYRDSPGSAGATDALVLAAQLPLCE